MAKVIWYEVYKAVPNMFDGDMEITRFQSTTDEKEAFDKLTSHTCDFSRE